MCSLQGLLEKEFQTPNFAAGAIAADLTNFVQLVRRHVKRCELKTTPQQRAVLNVMFHGALEFIPAKDSDHVILKFIHEDYVQEFTSSAAKSGFDVVLLLGTTWREMRKFQLAAPNVKFIGYFGLMDMKDEQRQNRDIAAARKEIKTAGPLSAHARTFLRWVSSDHKMVNPWYYKRGQNIAQNVDHCYAIDSLAHFSKKHIRRILNMTNCLTIDYCQLYCPEIEYQDKVTNEVLEVEWIRQGSSAYMRHLRGYSSGYYHNMDRLMQWQNHSIVTMSPDTVQRHGWVRSGHALFNEVVLNRSSYVKGTIDAVNESNTKLIVTNIKAQLGLIPIFDSLKWLRTRVIDVYYVRADKYFKMLHYCERISTESFEPTKIYSCSIALMDKIIIAMAEIQSDWQIDWKDHMIAVEFAMLHACMIRGRAFSAVKDFISISKNGGHYPMWLVAKFNQFLDFITLKNFNVILDFIDQFIKFMPDWRIESACNQWLTDHGENFKFNSDRLYRVDENFDPDDDGFSESSDSSGSTIFTCSGGTVTSMVANEVQDGNLIDFPVPAAVSNVVNENPEWSDFHGSGFNDLNSVHNAMIEELAQDKSVPQNSMALIIPEDPRGQVIAQANVERLKTVLSGFNEFHGLELGNEVPFWRSELFDQKVSSVRSGKQQLKLWKKIKACIPNEAYKFKGLPHEALRLRYAVDIGGQNTYIAEKLHALGTPAICIDPNGVGLARNLIKAPFQTVILPVRADLVILSHVIHHIDHTALKSWLARNCAPGAFIIVRDHDVRNGHDIEFLTYFHRIFKDAEPNERYNFITSDQVIDLLPEAELVQVASNLENKELLCFARTYRVHKDFSKGRGEFFSCPHTVCCEQLSNFKTDMFFKVLDREYTNYTDMQRRAYDAYKFVMPLQSYDRIKVEVWNMVAGAGKTFKVIQNFTSKDLYIAPTNKLLDEFRSDKAIRKMFMHGDIPAKTYFKVFDTEHGRKAFSLSSAETIYVDEAFKMPFAYFIMLFTLAPNARFILLGDPEQIEFNPDYAVLVGEQRLSKWLHCFNRIDTSEETHRMPDDPCNLLRKAEQYRIFSKSNKTALGRKFEFTHGEGIEGMRKARIINTGPRSGEYETVHNMCFSNDCKNLLTEIISIFTINQSQGVTVDGVNIFFSKHDSNLKSLRFMRIVALTRAKEWINFVAMDDVGRRLIAQLGWNSELIKINTEIYTGLTVVPKPNYSVECESPFKSENVMSVKMKFEPNLMMQMLEVPQFNNDQHSVEILDNENWTKFALKPAAFQEQKFRLSKRLQPSMFGKKYFVASARQTIATMIRRTVNMKDAKNIQLTDVTFPIAESCVESFVEKCLKKHLSVSQLNEKLWSNMLEIYNKYKEKGTLPVIDFLQPHNCVIREHLKQIYKVKPYGETFEDAHKDKAGQPIRAWALEVNAAVCAYMRTVEQLIIENLNDNVIFANGLSDDQLQDRFNNIRNYDCEIDDDAEEYDGSQTKATTQIEQMFLSWLWNCDVTDFYFEMRRGMYVLGKFFSYWLNCIKSSGEPGTLLLNSILRLILANNSYSNWVAMAVKGDDLRVFGNNGVTTCSFRIVRNFTKMTFKIVNHPVSEFCSLMYYGGILFFDFIKLAKRLLSRDYTFDLKFVERAAIPDQKLTLFSQEKIMRGMIGTFEQYQSAVKDKLSVYQRHPTEVTEGLAKAYSLDKATISSIMCMLLDFSDMPLQKLKTFVDDYELLIR